MRDRMSMLAHTHAPLVGVHGWALVAYQAQHLPIILQPLLLLAEHSHIIEAEGQLSSGRQPRDSGKRDTRCGRPQTRLHRR
jgi:hypothetical protein